MEPGVADQDFGLCAGDAVTEDEGEGPGDGETPPDGGNELPADDEEHSPDGEEKADDDEEHEESQKKPSQLSPFWIHQMLGTTPRTMQLVNLRLLPKIQNMPPVVM